MQPRRDGADSRGMVMDELRLSVNDPLRPVDARSRLAESLVRTARIPVASRYDRATCEITGYLRIRRSRTKGSLRRIAVPGRYADLHGAYELREAVQPRLRAALEAMLLAGVGVE